MAFLGSLGLALLASLLSPDAAAAETTVRDALLCEASYRLGSMFGDKSLLQGKKQKDGVTLRITKQSMMCGGNKIPITFGEFEADDVTPLDVFNVLADTAHQKEWDGLIASETGLGDFPDQEATGVALSFQAHPFSDRQVFEWQAYNASRDFGEFWVVFSTEDNARLHQKAAREDGAVHAQNCLAAYHIMAKPGGGAHVVFTSEVNAHPFLLSAEFIFNIMWTKTVDYINALRTRAQDQAQQRAASGEEPRPVVSSELLFDHEGNSAQRCAPGGGLAALTMTYEAKAAPGEPRSLWKSKYFPFLALLVPGSAAALLLGVVIGRRTARRPKPDGARQMTRAADAENLLEQEQ